MKTHLCMPVGIEKAFIKRKLSSFIEKQSVLEAKKKAKVQRALE